MLGLKRLSTTNDIVSSGKGINAVKNLRKQQTTGEIFPNRLGT